ncbi:NAD-dependent protein deacylase [Desulfococcaceae bacterium HSG9]|nr:NAD-dependent protein deacylase [Desulfococcaceae bacterium HSG9]
MSELRDLIDQASRLVAFTGAGISAESGIPTYRGQEGLWQKYDPAKYADITYFRKNPAYYWNFFREVRYPMLKQAQPNQAHLALARLEQMGKLRAIITQNIDGLHQQAGSRKVVELHGNSRRFFCLRCGEREAMEQVYVRLSEEIQPACISCGGQLRPEVVFFGEALSASVMVEAETLTRESDLFVVVGSSLVVQPAAQFPVQAKQNGSRLVIVNKDPTPLDALADMVYHRQASEVFGTAV